MSVTRRDQDVMSFRIYIDESGTHAENWLVIGALFVPDHGTLHPALCKVKDDIGYLNTSPKSSAKYKETHLTAFRSFRDVDVAKGWLDAFMTHQCYFRCVVIDWSIWDGKYFGGAFWKGYASGSLNRHFPKFSEWFWRPTK
jgi:hypothetical protein